MNLTNDTLLWEKIRNGNTAAFEQLYHTYYTFLMQTTLITVKDPFVTEELVQQLFVKLWANRSSIYISENIKGYLCRMRQHMLYDHYKSSATKHQHNSTNELPLSYTHIEERLHARMQLQQIKQELAKMPSRKRLAWQLVKLEGLSCEAVAAHFFTKERTVRNQVTAAATALSAKIKQHEG